MKDKKITVKLTEDSIKLLLRSMESEMHSKLERIVSMSARGDGCRATFDDKESYINAHLERRDSLKEEYKYVNTALKKFYKQRTDAIQEQLKKEAQEALKKERV